MDKILFVNAIILVGVMNVYSKPINNLEDNNIWMLPTPIYNTNYKTYSNYESNEISPKITITHRFATALQKGINYNRRTKKPIPAPTTENNVPQETSTLKSYSKSNKIPQSGLVKTIERFNYQTRIVKPIPRSTEEDNNIPQVSSTVNKFYIPKDIKAINDLYVPRKRISSSTNKKQVNIPSIHLQPISQKNEVQIHSRISSNTVEYSQRNNKVEHNNIHKESSTELSQENMKVLVDDIFDAPIKSAPTEIAPIELAPRFKPAPIDDVIICSLLGGGCV